MVIDSSALVAIIRKEHDAPQLAEVLSNRPNSRMSAAAYVETAIVVDNSRDPVVSARLDDLLAEAAVDVVPFTPVQARIARAAYRDYGRASGHPAQLNLGDCFSYALAKELREPLLFKGDDFGHTDIESAI